MQKFSLITIVTVFIAICVMVSFQEDNKPPQLSAIGDWELLKRQYETWKTRLQSSEFPSRYTLSFISPRMHSMSEADIAGKAALECATGTGRPHRTTRYRRNDPRRKAVKKLHEY